MRFFGTPWGVVEFSRYRVGVEEVIASSPYSFMRMVPINPEQ